MNTRAIGNAGEDIACKYLANKDFIVIDRNYTKKWGEIDIVAILKTETGLVKCVHFFEVKSVTGFWEKGINQDVMDRVRPEENVNIQKVKRLRRTIKTYMAEKVRPSQNREDFGEISFEFHVLCVYMNTYSKTARIKWLKNVIL